MGTETVFMKDNHFFPQKVTFYGKQILLFLHSGCRWGLSSAGSHRLNIFTNNTPRILETRVSFCLSKIINKYFEKYNYNLYVPCWLKSSQYSTEHSCIQKWLIHWHDWIVIYAVSAICVITVTSNTNLNFLSDSTQWICCFAFHQMSQMYSSHKGSDWSLWNLISVKTKIILFKTIITSYL